MDNNRNEILKLLKERTELLFRWNVEYGKGKGETQEARDILYKKNSVSKKIKKLGGYFNDISEELFNEVKQEFLNKRLEKIDRDIAEQIDYNQLSVPSNLTSGK